MLGPFWADKSIISNWKTNQKKWLDAFSQAGPPHAENWPVVLKMKPARLAAGSWQLATGNWQVRGSLDTLLRALRGARWRICHNVLWYYHIIVLSRRHLMALSSYLIVISLYMHVASPLLRRFSKILEQPFKMSCV